MKYNILIKLIMFCVLGLLYGSVEAYAMEKSWRFRVLLDDSEIGQHTFNLRKQGEKTFVTVKAGFDVRLLFFSVYTYEHHNHETWNENCLESIRSRTNDNGEIQYLRGESVKDAILVEKTTGTERLEGCIKTFAYWDPEFLNSERLLNTQTGELEPVKVEKIGETTIQVKGEKTTAYHYRLLAEEFSIELWYSVDDQEWLALRSTTRNGAVLQYEKI